MLQHVNSFWDEWGLFRYPPLIYTTATLMGTYEPTYPFQWKKVAKANKQHHTTKEFATLNLFLATSVKPSSQASSLQFPRYFQVPFFLLMTFRLLSSAKEGSTWLATKLALVSLRLLFNICIAFNLFKTALYMKHIQSTIHFR